MSLRKFDPKVFHEQISYDIKKKRLTWKPRELKNNIFELLGLARQIFGVKLKGKPYQVDDETWAVNVEVE